MLWLTQLPLAFPISATGVAESKHKLLFYSRLLFNSICCICTLGFNCQYVIANSCLSLIPFYCIQTKAPVHLCYGEFQPRSSVAFVDYLQTHLLPRPSCQRSATSYSRTNSHKTRTPCSGRCQSINDYFGRKRQVPSAAVYILYHLFIEFYLYTASYGVKQLLKYITGSRYSVPSMCHTSSLLPPPPHPVHGRNGPNKMAEMCDIIPFTLLQGMPFFFFFSIDSPFPQVNPPEKDCLFICPASCAKRPLKCHSETQLNKSRPKVELKPSFKLRRPQVRELQNGNGHEKVCCQEQSKVWRSQVISADCASSPIK